MPDAKLGVGRIVRPEYEIDVNISRHFVKSLCALTGMSMASLSSDPVSPKGKGECRSERLAGCYGDGLRTRLCGRLVGWVRERAYPRTVLREMPGECATGSSL